MWISAPDAELATRCRSYTTGFAPRYRKTRILWCNGQAIALAESAQLVGVAVERAKRYRPPRRKPISVIPSRKVGRRRLYLRQQIEALLLDA
jgi:hypothetical protein